MNVNEPPLSVGDLLRLARAGVASCEELDEIIVCGLHVYNRMFRWPLTSVEKGISTSRILDLISGMEIHVGNPFAVIAKLAAAARASQVEMRSMQEFREALQHPGAIQALLVDPWSKSLGMVELGLQEEKEEEEEEEEEQEQEGSGESNTEVFVKRADVLHALKWERGCCSKTVGGQMRVYMCEFDGGFPLWPGVRIGGQRTLIGRLLVVQERMVRFGGHSACVQYGGPGLMDAWKALGIEWIGAKRGKRSIQKDVEDSVAVAEAKAAGSGVQVMSLDSVQVCAACGAACKTLKACGRCMVVRYCNQDCQRAHWKDHKGQCKKP